MGSAGIELETAQGVATLWLSRPEARNAFDGSLLAALASAFAGIDADPSVRVLIVTGRGSAFCAGADLAWMRRAVDFTISENRRDSRAIADAFLALRRMRKPVLAAVNGPAFGGGMGFLGAADVVVASRSAVFSLSEVRLGLAPACISPFLLRKAPAGALRRWMLGGERFGPEEARAAGLVDAVVAPEDLLPESRRIASALCEAAPQAQAAVKELLENVPGMGLDAALDYAVDMIARLRAGPEAQKGMRCFLEKKPCAWN